MRHESLEAVAKQVLEFAGVHGSGSLPFSASAQHSVIASSKRQRLAVKFRRWRLTTQPRAFMNAME